MRNKHLRSRDPVTVFLAMGRSKSALPDLDKVITMKPDFVSARLQRGNIHLKQGTFEDARRDFEGVLDISPDNEEALAKLEEVQPLEQALSDAETLLRCGAPIPRRVFFSCHATRFTPSTSSISGTSVRIIMLSRLTF